MSQKNETIPLILALIITLALLGGGYWWFTKSGGIQGLIGGSNNENLDPTNNQPVTTNSSPDAPTNEFTAPNNVPAGTTIRIEGSTSMVQINQALKNSFEQQFPNTRIVTLAGGTEKGIEAVRSGSADLAAISRPLTPQEKSTGLTAVPVAQDAIAIVVGIANPLRGGLTQEQVVKIFQGQITDWSAVGRTASGTIQVINRPPVSGTRQAFQELVLKGGNFGNGANFTTLDRDATTPLFQALGENGIGYATYAQAANQSTVQVVPVDGITPQAVNYPYQRNLAYVYQQPASPQVQAFLGFANSQPGQQAIAEAN
ncbi:MAG: phosphate ABC transporter substrate-binding protein [Oscillatoria sp. PMC 1051.18]|nr:phosphate ABC transporter substrate-binding protein [Oscillatoria sp. PMC 1050.18]MEC5033075.1 phosphate ABC transporter substrate-binding protein [Oscillatoria sp. PMC 1051.18]